MADSDLFSSAQQPLITEEMVEAYKARDARLKDVDLMLQFSNEIQKSIVVKIILEKAKEAADKALEDLAHIDPTNVKEIIKLQFFVHRARFIGQIIEDVREKGTKAEQSLKDDSMGIS